MNLIIIININFGVLDLDSKNGVTVYRTAIYMNSQNFIHNSNCSLKFFIYIYFNRNVLLTFSQFFAKNVNFFIIRLV